MKKFDKFETAKIKTGSIFDPLPKGAYVLKILRAAEEQNKNSEGSHIKIAFDIAEGDQKDFYKKQFDASTNEDKRWPFDGVINLAVPDDNSPQWMIDNFGTFVSVLEESNSGYHWDWDETKWKNLLIGGLFRIEQTENNGNVYDHTRPYWFRSAQSVREGKFGRLPKDKLIQQKTAAAPSDAFMTVSETEADEVPF